MEKTSFCDQLDGSKVGDGLWRRPYSLKTVDWISSKTWFELDKLR